MALRGIEQLLGLVGVLTINQRDVECDVMFHDCYPRFAIVSALNFRQASDVDTVIVGSLLDTKRLLLLVGLTCSPRGSQKILSA
jgi:hypothetical protein